MIHPKLRKRQCLVTNYVRAWPVVSAAFAGVTDLLRAISACYLKWLIGAGV